MTALRLGVQLLRQTAFIPQTIPASVPRLDSRIKTTAAARKADSVPHLVSLGGASFIIRPERKEQSRLISRRCQDK